MKRKLFLILVPLFLVVLGFSQKNEWQYISDGTYTKANSLLLNVDSTGVIIDKSFSKETDTTEVYKADGKFFPIEDELYAVRYGFDFRIPDTTRFAHIKCFLSTGQGVPPVPIGEFRISDHQGWVQHQETFLFWGGAALANEGGNLYWKVVKGTAEIANQNLTIARVNDQRPKPILEIGNIDEVGDVATTIVGPFVELFEETRINTRPDHFDVDLGLAQITIKKPGVYIARFGVSFRENPTSTTSRDNIAFWLETGTATNFGNDDNPADNISHYFQGNYLRDTAGHLESSDGGSTRYIVVEEADLPYTFTCSRDQVAGSGGTVTLHGTNNFFQLEKVD